MVVEGGGGGEVETTENKNTLGTEQGNPLEKLTEISTKTASLLRLLWIKILGTFSAFTAQKVLEKKH